VNGTHGADSSERSINLGPLFLLGAVLLLLGLVRRRPLVVALGIAAAWADQRFPFGLTLKRRLDAKLRSRIDPHA
jgi:hypothetical protein